MSDYIYVGQTTDDDGDPVRVLRADEIVYVEGIMTPDRTVVEFNFAATEAYDLADLIRQAADAVTS